MIILYIFSYYGIPTMLLIYAPQIAFFFWRKKKKLGKLESSMSPVKEKI